MAGVVEIPMSDFGLTTCEQVAAARGCDPATVRRWVAMGWVPALVVGSGRSAKFLVREKDARAFRPPPPGRAKKAPPEKPTKGRVPKKSGKKSRNQ